MPKITYEVTLPDGSTKTRKSARTYTHAVVARGTQGWGLISFCGSLQLAEHRAADWRRGVPSEPTQIVTARVIEPLTDRQRQFLIEIGDRTVEMLGTSQLVALVKRGLVTRSFIGMRCWHVRRTEAGRKAVAPLAIRSQATAPAPAPGTQAPSSMTATGAPRTSTP